MVGAQQGIEPAGSGAAVVVRIDCDLPFILLRSLPMLRPIEPQGLRQVPEMKHNRQSLAGQGGFNFGYVDMPARYIFCFIDQSLTRPNRINGVTPAGACALNLRSKASDLIEAVQITVRPECKP